MHERRKEAKERAEKKGVIDTFEEDLDAHLDQVVERLEDTNSKVTTARKIEDSHREQGEFVDKSKTFTTFDNRQINMFERERESSIAIN